jgi:L-alanine-DL-glutamate epimerase-like enolase superfamily enzyme
MRIVSFEIWAVDLSLRRTIGHSAGSRRVSDSLLVKCTLDDGTAGFGECLPRVYVTGETRDGAYGLLRERVLPHLVGREFESWAQVWAFLDDCDGKAPGAWVTRDVPQTAAWCAVDLALLDAFGRAFGRSVFPQDGKGPSAGLRYSGVLTYEPGIRLVKSCLLFRLYGLRSVKVKVGRRDDLAALRTARMVLGPRADIRVDANMAWDFDQAQRTMREMARLGVRCFEQPLAAGALEDMGRLARATGLMVMADESIQDRDSLVRLIERKACTAINVRVSKCGGLAASLRRCREAVAAGLTLQVGCQVGESSLLSAAQLALLSQVPEVAYAEGCFGRHLLREDTAEPVLQFGYAGRPPRIPAGAGLGVGLREERLQRWTTRHDTIGGR